MDCSTDVKKEKKVSDMMMMTRINAEKYCLDAI